MSAFRLSRMRGRKGLRVIAVALAGALLAACSRETSAPAPDITLASCRLKGVEIALRCGTLLVAEDRDAQDGKGRRIPIGFAVIPALARKPEPDAIVVFAGGPGQAATDVAGAVYPLFAKLNRDRDIVLIDQRGTGRSNPLSCPETRADAMAEALDFHRLGPQVEACAKRLSATADLTRYTTDIAMKDVDDVRAQLGYRRIDLWGASYGTRAALEYARQFPDHVRTMTLDGVFPAWEKLPLSFGLDTYAGIEGMTTACEHDASCAKRYPNLRADVDALFSRVADKPAPIDIVHPSTGAKERVTLTTAGLASMLRSPLYISLTASLLPSAIEAASHGNFDELAALDLTIGNSLEDSVALGMHLSVICSEDLSSIDAADRASAKLEVATSSHDGRPNPLALIYDDQYRELCAHWPARRPPAAYFETLKGKPGSNVPTLLLSGGIDPATPPAHAEAVARTLTDVRHLIAPNVGHGVSSQGCAPDLIEQFIKSGNPHAPKGDCLAAIPRPPFFVPIVASRRDHDSASVP